VLQLERLFQSIANLLPAVKQQIALAPPKKERRFIPRMNHGAFALGLL